MIVMNTYRDRLASGLKCVALWWFLSAYVAGVVGAIELGRDAALLNIVATTMFSVFLAIGVAIGARGPAVANTINLSEPKVPVEPQSDLPRPLPVVSTTPTLKPYSAFIETRGRHGTVIVVGKSKEAAKKQIIDMYPDCKIMFFDEWLRDRNFMVRGNLDI